MSEVKREESEVREVAQVSMQLTSGGVSSSHVRRDHGRDQ